MVIRNLVALVALLELGTLPCKIWFGPSLPGVLECVALSHRQQILNELYCGEENCYQLLGVPQDASKQRIRSAYHRASVTLHPDRNPDPAAHEKFKLIAKAHAVLSKEDERAAYDYYLSHPDDLWSLYMGLRAVYPTPTHPGVVAVLVILFATAGQVVNRKWAQQHSISAMRNVPAVKKAIADILKQKHGTKFRRLSPQEQEEEREAAFTKVLNDVAINDKKIEEVGAVRVTELIAVRVILLPYTILRMILWRLRWWWRYTLWKRDYDTEARTYITRTVAGYSEEQWQNLQEEARTALLEKQLWWEPRKLKFLEEQAEEQRLSRISSTRYRQWKRWKRKNPGGPVDVD